MFFALGDTLLISFKTNSDLKFSKCQEYIWNTLEYNNTHRPIGSIYYIVYFPTFTKTTSKCR